MKRGDLLTTLHDQYNTYTSPIQDPDAFYHDIFEISHEATSVAEFHHLADNRRRQRLHELHDALDAVSLEITANPALINMPQWQHAIQLFRTNSLDSLIYFFASYLPINPNWHPSHHTSTHFTNSAESMSHKPDEEHRLNDTHKFHLSTSVGDEGLQPVPLSLLPPSALPGIPVIDQQAEQNESIGITLLAAAAPPISEVGPEQIRPREHILTIQDGKDAAQSRDERSTIFVTDYLETSTCWNKITYNEIIRPNISVASICSTMLTSEKPKKIKRDCPREPASTGMEADGKYTSSSPKRRRKED
ncbi:hypothetical protein TRIATDRAFT_303128 [Trichoderma atroviride IMI 206040]|uniref:Uncharacterized protein n=2 Tax=Hypocrea atroviridis TaxID=63577 RepID=G9NDX6_HYPAI|nr:uncharacterized protein TRIATDRAFT_303128 [Trichoderma atroviride IMI 206040]EHK51146.1 hypothetical protein TRIATDRAFT_303128 [Trichoderma atroviride IMI 206040]